MGSNQEVPVLLGNESSKNNPIEHEKLETEGRQADDMTAQVDQPAWTQAAPTVSAQVNRDTSVYSLIESNKGVALSSNNVSEPAFYDRSQSYLTSGDDADRSATPTPPSEQDYVVNMSRSSITNQWNDSGDDDEDSLSEEDSYFQTSQRRAYLPSQQLESVSSPNQRDPDGMPSRVQHTLLRDTEDNEIYPTPTTSLVYAEVTYLDT